MNLNVNQIHSLNVQIRFLSNNLETHLMGNHLFANAKAEMIPELIEIKSMRPDVDNATVGIIQHLYLSSSCE